MTTTGTAFGARILPLTGAAREQAILDELPGSLPSWMRWVPISFTGKDAAGTSHEVVVSVLPDVLCIGTATDFLRVPMTPTTADAIAASLGGFLPTRLLSDAVWSAARLRVPPHPTTPDAGMVTSARYIQHNSMVEDDIARAGGPALGQIVAGAKKDIVISPFRPPGWVAIYGWHSMAGTPLQHLSYGAHSVDYVDYSHGVRVVRRAMKIDGAPADAFDVLRDRLLAPLLSDEGAFDAAHLLAGRVPSGGCASLDGACPTPPAPPGVKPSPSPARGLAIGAALTVAAVVGAVLAGRLDT